MYILHHPIRSGISASNSMLAVSMSGTSSVQSRLIDAVMAKSSRPLSSHVFSSTDITFQVAEYPPVQSAI